MPRKASLSPFLCLRCQAKSLLRSSSRLPYRQARTYADHPAFAPRQYPNLRHITQNPGLYEQNCLSRNYKHLSQHSWHILALSQERAAINQALHAGRHDNNRRQSQINHLQALARAGPLAAADLAQLDALIEGNRQFKLETAAQAAQEEALHAEAVALALALPNLSSAHTPDGNTPEVLSTHLAAPDALTRRGRSHVDIGAELGLLDFAAAGAVAGWGWYYLTGAAALLEQALVQYALATLHTAGWGVVAAPSVAYAHIAAACGFQPRDRHGEQQVYRIAQETGDGAERCLTGTAEIPLAGGGARGADTKGLYRVHEFTKVEMFAWTWPDEVEAAELGGGEGRASQADAVFEEMVAMQKRMLGELGLSFRVLEMPAEELGAAAARKQDVEVYFPSRQKDDGWGEVTSTSNCTDYQSRRLAARLQLLNKKQDWPWTLNGTAMAVPRVLAAILENGWNEEEKSVTIPEVLRPWMFGLERIVK